MTFMTLLDTDQPVIVANGLTEADAVTTPAPETVIALEEGQNVTLATIEPQQTAVAVEQAQPFHVALVENDPAMMAVGAPSGVMIVVNFIAP